MMPMSSPDASAPPRAQTPQVSELSPSDHGVWDAFVRSCSEGTIFQTIEWAEIVTRVFQHQHHYLIAKRDDQVCGVLPLTKVSSAFFGKTLISVPFGVYGGLLSSDQETTEALIAAAHQLGTDLGVKYIELRHLHRPEIDLPSTNLYYTFIEDIPPTAEECLTRIPRKARAEVRKCLRDDQLTIEEGGIDLADFHRLFSLNKRSLGSPLFPSSLFWHIQDVFGDRAPIHVVRKAGEVVSAVLSFTHEGTLMPYYSGAVPQAQAMRANNFMYFKLMEWGSERGFQRFDFGRSRKDTGSFSFKKHQGFEPKPLSYDYILVGDSEIPELNPSNPKYRIAKKVFSNMPLWMAQKAGSWLVKRAPF